MDRDRNESSGISTWIVTAISVLLLSISCADPYSGPPPRTFTQRPITEDERTEMFHHIEIAIGTPYVWGGDTLHLESIDDLHRGDFIFFDENGDGRITHNAVFDMVDEEGSVWVYDAYSKLDAVVHRIVDEFEAKGPLFGRPLVLVLD